MATIETNLADASEQSVVRVGRTVERPLARRHFPGTVRDVATWLAGPARKIPEALDLVDELCWRLVGAEVPISRMTFHLPTLHPQYYSTGGRWSLATGQTEETLVVHGVRQSSQYRESPLRRVVEAGEIVRRHLEDADAILDFPILRELQASGVTDYLAVPLELSSGRWIAITLATDRKGGFRDDELAELKSLGPYLAPILELQVARHVTRNVLDAYLGRTTGGRVLAGDIMRGRGETIRAIIWLSDLRGFTQLSDQLPGDQVISILNAHFERVVREVHARNGEVLKFMGDGLLAIFAVPDAAFAPGATANALAAAEAAIASMDALAGDPILGGEPPPKMCVSIHFGDVIYGNIGAADRLDFTTIGPAVNLVSRLDQLTKTLERRILVTDNFARVCERPLQSLGRHPLRGLTEAHEIFTVPDAVTT